MQHTRPKPVAPQRILASRIALVGPHVPTSKYLYLTKLAWAETWVRGGRIPISPASTYLSKQRDGNLTPDKNVIHDAPVDVTKLAGIRIAPGTNIVGLTIRNTGSGNVRNPDFANANYYREDGIILSFASRNRLSIAKRLNKEACVELLDMEALKDAFDRQLGQTSTMKACDYTTDHRRNHFLKSVEDAWQCEYRIFWPLPKMMEVVVPAGLARRVEILPDAALYLPKQEQ